METTNFAKKVIKKLGSHVLGIFSILVGTPTYGMIKYIYLRNKARVIVFVAE